MISPLTSKGKKATETTLKEFLAQANPSIGKAPWKEGHTNKPQGDKPQAPASIVM